MSHLLVFVALLFALPAQAELTIEWVTVGDPGNTADDTGYGSVGYPYRISKHEVTNAQYSEFLNAVAATDTYGLYSTGMGTGLGGITRGGESGSYTYSAITGREDMPVNYVSSYDALRFANWLHNGQPTGAQDSTTTEDGSYTFSGPTSVGARNSGATIFLTSEDEWYKAAYFSGAAYFDYPADEDSQTTCAVPGSAANTANCDDAVGNVTDVGSYAGSPSPYGTFDQGGNVQEWNEASHHSSTRGMRGGGFASPPGDLAALAGTEINAASEFGDIGFRIASPGSASPVPSVSPVGMALLGGLVLGIGVVGLVIAARRRGAR